LQGLRPQDVKAKVDTVNHVLLIKTKRGFTQQQTKFGAENKLVRVIPLPRNIILEKLTVKFTPTGELIVKAPFLFRGQQMFPNKFQQKYQKDMKNLVPIHVSTKGNNIFGTQKEKQFYNFITIPVMPMKRNFQPQEQQEYFQGKQMKNLHNMHQTTETLHTPVQIIRDEVTGKPALLLTVCTVGFRPEDICVKMDKTQHVLIVEAGLRAQKQQRQLPFEMQQKLKGINMKYLRREYVLPQMVNVKKIAYRVLGYGLLRIKLPITKQTTDLKQWNVQEQPLHMGWEKPVRNLRI